MFLSKVWLDVYDRRQLRVLTNCYAAHALVSAGCGSMKNGRRVLFRPEGNNAEHPYLLVQSDTMPDWERAESFVGTRLSAECKEFEFPRVSTGSRVRFRLRANPVKTIRGGVDEARDNRGNRKRIRVPLRLEDEQQDWLSRKLRQAGASLEGVVIQQEGDVIGRPNKSGSRIKLYSARFDGVLSVENPSDFEVALSSGIGPGKGFGFGLVSIAPS